MMERYEMIFVLDVAKAVYAAKCAALDAGNTRAQQRMAEDALTSAFTLYGNPDVRELLKNASSSAVHVPPSTKGNRR